MNTYKKPRGNKAKRDKDSILADTKNLLYILYGCIQRMPKIERIPRTRLCRAMKEGSKYKGYYWKFKE